MVVVPTPRYPIHLVAPALAGATRRAAPPATGGVDAIAEAVRARTRPRVVIVSFPHNPTTAVATAEELQRLVDLAREHDFLLVHDFAYADVAFDGHRAALGARRRRSAECAVELYSLTKSLLDGGLARRLRARPRRRRRRAREAEVLPRLRHLPADPDRRRPSRCARRADYPAEVCEIYRCAATRSAPGLARAGWQVEPPRGTMFVWAPIPERFRDARLARVRAAARARGARRGQPGHRLRRRAATVTCASRSSRTSSGSARRRAAIRKLLAAR